jgi:hypothetical protein
MALGKRERNAIQLARVNALGKVLKRMGMFKKPGR